LNAIATAVIGGTSLFGGRGKVYTALLGALVIASLESGLGLLNIPSSLQYIITGIVLLLAVILDSISRRNQKRSGLA
jgi:ABC-type xylose transport system permease subunit